LPAQLIRGQTHDRRICNALRSTFAATLVFAGTSNVGVSEGAIMSGLNPRPVGSIAFVVVLVLCGFSVGAAARPSRAADCLAAPNGPAPQGNHWYYHTDRATQRKCWALRVTGSQPQQVVARAGNESPPPSPPPSAPALDRRSFASFKEFMAQHGGANLSERDIEKLYAEFLEWNGKP
jgi:hypothetical protein